MKISAKSSTILLLLALSSVLASATTDCNFTTVGTTMTLTNDCTTDTTITVPDGYTLNGGGHTITAVDPPGNTWGGAVIANAPGANTANVKNVIVDTPHVAPNTCTTVIGIYFDSISGSITGSSVLHAGAFGCASGIYASGIAITNYSGLSGLTVTVSNNRVLLTNGTAFYSNNYGGDLFLNVTGNEFSGAQYAEWAINLYNLGGSLTANIAKNLVETGPSGLHGGIVIYHTSPGTKVLGNNINLVSGNAFVGVSIQADNAVVSGNRGFNYSSVLSFNMGIDNEGENDHSSNAISRNEVRCYQTPFVNAGESNGNVVLPCPF